MEIFSFKSRNNKTTLNCTLKNIVRNIVGTTGMVQWLFQEAECGIFLMSHPVWPTSFITSLANGFWAVGRWLLHFLLGTSITATQKTKDRSTKRPLSTSDLAFFTFLFYVQLGESVPSIILSSLLMFLFGQVNSINQQIIMTWIR